MPQNRTALSLVIHSILFSITSSATLLNASTDPISIGSNSERSNGSHEQIKLINEGIPNSYIVLPEDASQLEHLAADEITKYIREISGATLETTIAKDDRELDQIVSQRPRRIPILIGETLSPDAVNLIQEKGILEDSFLLDVEPKQARLAGLSPRGTLYAAYELIEQLGVRWYMPGDFGTVVPKRNTITLPVQKTIQIPSFDGRLLQGIATGDWTRRARLQDGSATVAGAHGIPPFNNKNNLNQLFSSHPEYFALVNGRRQTRQLCLSNPTVLQMAVQATLDYFERNPLQPFISMGPNDGEGYCECENCRALDQGVYDPISAKTSMSDRYIWFFNQILKRIESRYPKKKIAWYAYARHFMPTAIQPDARIVHVLAPISLDRARGMINPMSPDRGILKNVIEGWRKLGSNDMYFRGYYNPLACIQAPFSQVDCIRSETPILRDFGVKGMRMEVIPGGWATSGPSIYLASRLMWNADADVNAIMRDFTEKFFGPSAEPMARYFEELDRASRDTPFFAGGSYPLPLIYTDQRLSLLRGLLNEAKQNAKDQEDVYRSRINGFCMAFDRLEAFLQTMNARNSFDFKKAKEKVAEFNNIGDQMSNTVLDDTVERDDSSMRLLDSHNRSDNPKNMFNRFWNQPVISGYQRTVEKGELVAGLPAVWDFLIDPTDIGELAEWERDGKIGGNWQRIRAYPETWSEYGLHYYKGDAWYRAPITIPEKFKGRKIYLWFGGVDEFAKVWLNGKFLGTNLEPGEGIPGVPETFMPFEFQATDVVRFGSANPNWIAVKITNKRVDELGTGGIVAPVMFWSPKDESGDRKTGSAPPETRTQEKADASSN